ncbi:MAG: DUF3299 domain-containing protein [Hyphomicrobiaceae bacterium]
MRVVLQRTAARFAAGRADERTTGRRLGLAAAIAGVVLMLAAVPATNAEDAPKALKWADLIPASAAPKAGGLKSFLAGRPKSSSPDHTAIPEGRWLSAGTSSEAQATSTPAPVVEALDGQRIKIGGYVVPLDFDATKVKEFLLVPFVGACIHVPPPPANQIVYVKSEAGFEVKGSFEPVWVTGKLRATPTFTGLAETGYALTAEAVEARAE